jgi:hypothetical protein
MRKFLIAAVVAVAGLVASATQSQAAFEFGVKITVGASDVFIYDNDGVNDVNGAVKKIAYSGTLDGVDFTFTLITTNSPGTGTTAQLAIGNLDLNNTTGVMKSISIQAAANDYATGITQALLPLSMSFTAQVTHVSVNDTTTVEYKALVGTGANNTATTGTPPTALDFPFGAPDASLVKTLNFTNFMGSTTLGIDAVKNNAFAPGGVPYALGGELNISLAAGASLNTVSGKTEVIAPAPAGLLLALTGAPVLGVGAWIRRRRTAVVA